MTSDIYSMVNLNQSSGARPAMSTSPANLGIQADVGFADSSRQISQPSANAAQTSGVADQVESVRQSASGQPQSAGSSANDSAPTQSSGGSGRKSGTSTSYSSGKGAKEVVPTIRESATDSGPVFGVVAGWDSRMIYHGYDWIQRGVGSTSDSDSAGIWYTRATVEWQGLAGYIGYLQSDQKVNPRGYKRANNFVDEEFYSEVQAGISYTYAVAPGILDATVGYNAYWVTNDAFVGQNYTAEVYARLAYRQIPFITPSVAVFYLHGEQSYIFPEVEGFVYEARIDGNFKLFSFGSGGFVGLNPHVTFNVDGGYWTGGTESFYPISLQYGLNVPVVLNKNLSFNFHVNYFQSLVDQTNVISNPDVWGGVSVAYKF